MERPSLSECLQDVLLLFPLLAFVENAGTVAFMCVFNVVIGLDGDTHTATLEETDPNLRWLG